MNFQNMPPSHQLIRNLAAGSFVTGSLFLALMIGANESNINLTDQQKDKSIKVSENKEASSCPIPATAKANQEGKSHLVDKTVIHKEKSVTLAKKSMKKEKTITIAGKEKRLNSNEQTLAKVQQRLKELEQKKLQSKPVAIAKKSSNGGWMGLLLNE